MNKNKNFIIIGAGGHARVCADIAFAHSKYNVAGFVTKVDGENELLGDVSIIGNDLDLPELRGKYPYAFVGIGLEKNTRMRWTLFKKLLTLEYIVPYLISDKAIISHNFEVGSGTIIMPGVIANFGSSVGENSIINSGSIIEHDVSIGNNTHLAPGVIVNGGCKIGNNVFVGSGTTIRNGVKIEDGVYVKMASKIISDVGKETH